MGSEVAGTMGPGGILGPAKIVDIIDSIDLALQWEFLPTLAGGPTQGLESLLLPCQLEQFLLVFHETYRPKY
jgi:hypothetical protein